MPTQETGRDGETSHSEDEEEASEKQESAKSQQKFVPRNRSKKVYYFVPDSFLMQDPEK